MHISQNGSVTGTSLVLCDNSIKSKSSFVFDVHSLCGNVVLSLRRLLCKKVAANTLLKEAGFR